MRILITGITGFVGSHLAESYLKDGHQVYGTYRYHHLGNEMERIENFRNQLTLYDCDLTDRNSVFRIINQIKPDLIHHLAAQSFVRASWDNPEFTLFNNIGAQLNIFEIVRELKGRLFNFNPIIHIAGSSEEYGMIKENELPVREDNPLRPMSPYAVSKVAQDMLAQQYWMSYEFKTVITRGFNHEGARRGISFVTSAFASQAVDIINGKIKVIKVGNLEAKRDFTDIDDMIKAYKLAIKKCDYGTPYNICSGTTHKIQEILDYYVAKVKTISGIKVDIKQDPERMRPSDLPILLGDNSKFRRATGWSPEVSFEKMLDKIFNYWREK